MNTSWAYLSNNLVYSALFVYTIAFLSHAYEIAFAVKAPAIDDKKSSMDYSRTEKASRIATAMMILATISSLTSV